MLKTDTYVLGDAIAKLTDRIDDLAGDLEDLDDSTDEYQAVESRRDRLRYFKNGLEFQRDELDWDEDAEIELGAISAGEKALMNREVPDAADDDERVLWFIAASTVDAPYASPDDSLEETFTELSQCAHPAFADWLEAKANTLSVAGGPGNRSSTSSTETPTEDSATSANNTNSTTTSSSDSPTV